MDRMTSGGRRGVSKYSYGKMTEIPAWKPLQRSSYNSRSASQMVRSTSNPRKQGSKNPVVAKVANIRNQLIESSRKYKLERTSKSNIKQLSGTFDELAIQDERQQREKEKEEQYKRAKSEANKYLRRTRGDQRND